jgi:hypothetical protein
LDLDGADRLGGTPKKNAADRLGGTPEKNAADRLGTPDKADRLGGTPEKNQANGPAVRRRRPAEETQQRRGLRGFFWGGDQG